LKLQREITVINHSVIIIIIIITKFFLRRIHSLSKATSSWRGSSDFSFNFPYFPVSLRSTGSIVLLLPPRPVTSNLSFGYVLQKTFRTKHKSECKYARFILIHSHFLSCVLCIVVSCLLCLVVLCLLLLVVACIAVSCLVCLVVVLCVLL